jgi:N-acetylmuramoyl-L-alanine amidase
MWKRLTFTLILALLATFAGAALNSITSVTLTEAEDKTVLTLCLASSSGYDKQNLDGGRLALIIPQCVVTKQNLKGATGSALTGVDAANDGANARIVLSFSPQALSYKGVATISPPKVVFEIAKKPPAKVEPQSKASDLIPDKPKTTTPKNVTTGAVDLSPALSNPTTNEPLIASVTDKGSSKPNAANGMIKRIVLDPGHGGPYLGCAGISSGVEEKVVTLKIAYKLKKKLEDRLGVKVYMTRKDDSNILMRERTGLANRVKGDLFVSIHLNGDNNTKASGTEVYFLSEARTDAERAIASLENADFEAEVEEIHGSGLDMILGTMAQNEFLAESSALAELVQTNLVKTLGTRDRGVKQAPFYVLMYTYMPGILVEAGFLSNKEEEKKFLDPAFQDKVAEAMYAAIATYKRNYDKKMGYTEEKPKPSTSSKSSKKSSSKKK